MNKNEERRIRLAALGGKEPACDKCHKQIQTNHNRVVEIRSLQQSEKIKVYHGDCAVLVFAELYPQRDDKIRQAALDDIKPCIKAFENLLNAIQEDAAETECCKFNIKGEDSMCEIHSAFKKADKALAELEALKQTLGKFEQTKNGGKEVLSRNADDKK